MHTNGKHIHRARLEEIPKPPTQLYERGEWPSEDSKLLTVVGSRALTPYGREACEKLILELAGYPISIVSGLALGTDACAHRSALKAGLHTIAVPGSGLDDSIIYPRSNATLAKEILDSGGLLLSEHPDNHKAMPHDFPSRNRIMVGLSHAVLVIEAGPQSGTLITARLTHEYNRDLLCVPHRIGDAHGYGAHLFLRLGATLVSESLHILEMLGIDSHVKDERIVLQLSESEKHVYDLLAEPLSRDELLRRTHLDKADVLATLITMEIKGVLIEQFGAWHRT